MIITVKEGDTLFSISNMYNVPVSKISADNGITDDTLVTGQSLIIAIPDKSITTNQNTSATQISQSYDISKKQLFRNNYFLNGEDFVPKDSFVVINYENPALLSKITGGYAYDFISAKQLSSVINYLTYIMPFTYGFTSEGKLISPNDDYILESAFSSGVKALLHLSTLTGDGYFDSNLPSVIFSDLEIQARLIDNIISRVEEKGYSGVDVDFEYLPESEKENYVKFIELLSEKLHDIGKILVVAVPPKTSGEQRGVLVEGIDYKELGIFADYILVMAYEYGYKFGPPLAIAPVNQVRKVLDYATENVESEKILLGIPNYGYDWALPYIRGESDAPSISTVTAIQLAKEYGAEIMFDNEAMAPYFFYTDTNGIKHEVWFEDARSYMAKVELIEEYNLAGGFLWDLMRDNPQGFVTLNALLDII